MKKFVFKPPVIEAEQWHEGADIPCVEFADGTGKPYVVNQFGGFDFLADGVWIVKNPYGKGCAVYSPEMFEASYTAIEE